VPELYRIVVLKSSSAKCVEQRSGNQGAAEDSCNPFPLGEPRILHSAKWLTQEKTRLQRLVSRLSESLGRLFDKQQNIAMGRGTVLDYVRPEAQAVVDDLNELDNEEYEL